MPDWVLHAEGTDVAAWETGDPNAPAVAMVHGMEDSWQGWGAMAERLTADRRCRVVALDLPWRAGGDYRWHDAHGPAEWLTRALALVEGTADRVVAHSFGANTMLELLAAGRTWRSVVLLAPYYRPAGVPAADLAQEAREVLDLTLTGGLRTRLGDRDLEPDLFDGMARGLVDRVAPAAFPVFFESFDRSGRLDLGGELSPTLVLSGNHDPALADERAAALAMAMPSASFARRPHLTHFCHMTSADELARDVDRFMELTSPIGHTSGGHA